MSWMPWKPTDEQPWNLKRVVHLHRRTGFGATWPEIQRDLNDGPEIAMDRVLHGINESQPAEFDVLTRHLGDAAVGSSRPERLKAWWLLRMLTTLHPLREKLTLMWHNHFATSNAKVGNLAAMRVQNELFYSLGSADFGTLLQAIAVNPAMLVWLDAPSNRKGRPNENLARELMELFTLGVGNYTEKDVREAARALTGWSVSADGEFELRVSFHDTGDKTILGETGKWDGHDLLRILLKQTSAAERIAWRLCTTFMGENVVRSEDMQQLADMLRDSDLHIGKAVEAIVKSELFFAEANIGARIAEPVEFVVTALRAIEFVDPLPGTLKMARWTTELGQDLFYPPNVGGWSGGRNWLSTRHIVGRANFAAALVDGGLSPSFDAPDVAKLVRTNGGGSQIDEAITHLDELILGGRLAAESRVRIREALAAENAAPEQQMRLALALLLALPESQQT